MSYGPLAMVYTMGSIARDSIAHRLWAIVILINSKAVKMMKKGGWNEGDGLGKNRDGTYHDNTILSH